MAVEALDEFESERPFQLWSYTVSHAQLLLRCTRTNVEATRIDVLFKNVDRLSIPTSMQGLHIVRLSERQFRASGFGWEGTVDAPVCFAIEDTGSYSDPSSFPSSGWLDNPTP